MQTMVFVGILGFIVSGAAAQAPPRTNALPQRNLDPTLNHYLNMSGHVLAGEVVSDPVRQDKLFVYQNKKDPRAIYSCRVKVLESLHNPIVPQGRELTVVVVRWGDPHEKQPAGVSKGEKYIFFL